MSRETWLLMVKVARRKLAKAVWGTTPARPTRKKRSSLPLRSVREDHYAILLAAQY